MLIQLSSGKGRGRLTEEELLEKTTFMNCTGILESDQK